MRRGAQLLILLTLAALAGGTRLHASPLSPALTEAWTTSGTVNGEEWGYALAAAGDVNRDGYDDILLGAPKHGSEREGSAFLFLGSPAGLPTIPVWTSSGQKGSRYGHALSGVGDVNCDGWLDIAIGAPEYNNETPTTASDSGAVFVFYGSEDGFANVAEWSYVFWQTGAYLGYAVAGAGDANNDGCDDLLVGAPGYTNDQLNEGALFLLYGHKDGPGAGGMATVEGNAPVAGLGRAVAFLGDVNGDGHDDFAGGAPYYDGELEHAGAVFLYYGDHLAPHPAPGWPVLGEQENANLGWSVTAGNVNGDGYADLVVGMPGYLSADEEQVGAARLFHGGDGAMDTTPALTLVGDLALSNYGRAAAGIGDVNGDGYGDVVIGASRYTGDKLLEGAVFLYLGGPDGLSPSVAWRGEGDKADTGYGSAVAAAGDVNRDGSRDFLVGAPVYFVGTIPVGLARGYHGTGNSLFYSTHLPFLTSTP